MRAPSSFSKYQPCCSRILAKHSLDRLNEKIAWHDQQIAALRHTAPEQKR